MELTFYGVRGSFPVAHPKVTRVGGNTSCLAIRAPGAPPLIFDAGTGVRGCGRELMNQGFGDGGAEAYFLFSHTHWDHIQGFMFFEPFYKASNRFTVIARGTHDRRLQQVFAGQAQGAYFGHGLSAIPAGLNWKAIHEGDQLELGPYSVRTARLNHPGIAIGYRVEYQGKAFIYMTDTAPYRDQLLGEGYHERKQEQDPQVLAQIDAYGRELEQFVAGADVLVYDTFFTQEQFAQNPHWGHSTPEEGIRLARQGNVGRLFLYHHHPEAWDDMLDGRAKDYQTRLGDGELRIDVAREGMSIEI